MAKHEGGDGRIRLAGRSGRGAVSRRLFAVSQRPSRSPLSRDDVRARVERPSRPTARSAQDGRQAPGRSLAGRSLSSAAAPEFWTRRRRDANGAHRTRRRRAELLLLGARRRTALARRGRRAPRLAKRRFRDSWGPNTRCERGIESLWPKDRLRLQLTALRRLPEHVE